MIAFCAGLIDRSVVNSVGQRSKGVRTGDVGSPGTELEFAL